MIEKLIAYCARNRFIVFSVLAFAVAWGLWSVAHTPLDAVPDLSDVQVIVWTEWMGRSPDLVEDQITYPIITRLVAAPHVRAVRGISMFGMSFVYVIFEDGTDLYWARSRVLEYMNTVRGRLPDGVNPVIGPDATGVGWVFEYALVDTTGRHTLADLRSFQDWTLKYYLESVPGVAEVASIGGFVKQYQINVDPQALLAYSVPLPDVVDAVRKSNQDVGGRVIEFSSTEYFVRGRGYIRSVADIENIPVGMGRDGTPVLVRNIATVEIGPDIRRGIAELDGKGEVVGGIVVMRYGENALEVIDHVKRKLEEIEPSLPDGVEIVVGYDRSDLIHRAIDVLRKSLIEEMVVVSLVILLFLLHFRSALVPIVTLPIAVLLSFIPMYYMGITSNIMSLGGIAIAIGAMVDASIVLVENAHKRLEELPSSISRAERENAMIDALKAVGRPVFFSLLVITVSFFPIFSLQAQEGRLFRPLAYTKTFSMAFAAILAVTVAPALIFWLVRGKVRPEERHPVSRLLQRMYHPAIDFVLKRRRAVIVVALAIVLSAIPAYLMLGSEFMPPLNEGSILYMPTSVPGLPAGEASRILQIQDRILKEFPEVQTVFGKIGRAETPTDPAPLSMVETIVTLKPESEWRPGMTWDALIAEMDAKLQFPGMANIWWMPIQTRNEMLTTGIRSNLGIKIFGPDLEQMEKIGIEIERVLKELPDTRTAFAERLTSGYYLDFEVDRAAAARYGLTVDDVNMIVQSAIGGENVTMTVEGKERYPVNVRYARELRDDLDKLNRVLVPTPGGAQVPIAQLADIRFSNSAPMIYNEGGSRVSYVFVDVKGKSYGDYVRTAKQVIKDRVDLPSGYYLEFTGQYEHMERMKRRLQVIVPVTLFLVLFLIYLNTRSRTKTLIVLLAVPFSLAGAFWFLWLLDYNVSNAVWVGLIALAGIDAETGIIMLLYLDLAYEDRKRAGRMNTLDDLREAVHHGAVRRIRPKFMTWGTTLIGLLPIMWSAGAGADVMKRIAAPMVGGITLSVAMELLVYPVIFYMWRKRHLERGS
ncbi:MAG: CusA/CzcA family heavy metal efflux RND transporter [Candidatus Latescibacteria bacterium]|nr:CusA/CzcA family heavy metal efflux RND transporter [Candidatus Latescibacterota bacterium]